MPALARLATSLALSALMGPQALAGTARERSAPGPVEAAVRALRDSRHPEARPVSEVAAELAEPGRWEPLLDLLLAGRVPALEPEEREQILSVPQRELVLAALERVGDPSLRAIEARLPRPPSIAQRAAALWVHAAAGDRWSFERVLALALRDGEDELPPALEEPLREAFARILVRDVEAFEHLGATLVRARPPLRGPIVFAVGATRDRRGVAVLADLLPFNGDLVDVVVAQARLLGPSDDPHVNARMAELLRPLLSEGRPELARSVARTLGELGDADGAPLLVDLLESPSEALREDAHWALKRMSRAAYPADVGLWRRWHEAEHAWWSERSEQAFRDLERGSLRERLTALQALADRTLHRDEIAERIGDALYLSPAVVRKRACEVLARLGSPAGSRALAWTLDDPDAELRAAARAALTAIHGVTSLPDDAETCMRLLRL